MQNKLVSRCNANAKNIIRVQVFYSYSRLILSEEYNDLQYEVP